MSRLVEEVVRFDPSLPIARASTPPASWYCDREIDELERATVFRSSWQPLARATELPEVGSYVSGCFAGEPWLMVRGRDRTARAFYNVCRHKGREVVVGSGRAQELVCGYHAWRYDLAGRLRKAPRIGGIEDFDREAMSLPPLAVCEWGPWLFASRDPNAQPLVTQLPEIDRELSAGGWSRLRFAAKRSYELACNWKVYVDNYLDGGYHVPHMHPTLDAQLDMSRYRTELYQRSSAQTCPPASAPDARIGYDASSRIGTRALYAWIYPNLMINRYGDAFDSNHVIPLGPASCRIDYEFYFLETEGSEATAAIEQSIAQSELTQREDIAICESVQRGLASESYDRGRYAPEVEIGEHHFHRLLAADYRRGLAGR